MPTGKNILDDIQEHIDNEERVIVIVGDFGTQKMAVVNQVVTIHCVFVSKNDRMYFRTEMLHASKEKVDELLNAIQEKVSPFYFKVNYLQRTIRNFLIYSRRIFEVLPCNLRVELAS